MSLLTGRKPHDWTIFLSARVVSMSGSVLTALVLPVILFERTRSPFVTALAVSVAPVAYLLFGIVAGYLADTSDRRTMMFGCELCALAAIGAVVLVLDSDAPAVVALIPLLVMQIASVFFDAASAGVAPTLVDEARLPHAVGRLAALSTLVETAVPAAGGFLLVAVGTTGVLAVDAATFLVSACLIMAIRTPLSEHLERRADDLRTAAQRFRFAAEGAAFMRRSPLLLATTMCMAAQALVIAAYIGQLAPLVAERSTDLRIATGLVMAALAAGAFLGSLTAPRAMARFRPENILLVTTAVITTSAAAILLSSAYWILLAATFVWAVAGTNGIVMLAALRMQLAPADVVGRVVAFGRIVSWAVPGLTGALLAGAVASASTPATGIAVVGVLGLVVGTFGLLRLRRIDRSDDTGAIRPS